MSLSVHLTSVQGFKGKQERLAKVNFRGSPQQTPPVENYGDEAVWDQVFAWPLGTGLTEEELVEITVYNKVKLRSAKLIGSINLVLQQVMENGHLNVEEALLNSNNVPTDMIIRLSIKYQPPEGEGAFTDYMDENFSARRVGSQETLLGGESNQSSDWQLGRPMTASSTSGFLTPTMSHKGTTRSIKGMMKIGTKRKKKRDDIFDAHHMQLDNIDKGTKDDAVSEVVSTMDLVMSLPAYKKVGPIGKEDITAKETDFQVNISIHEGKQLIGLDIDPHIAVTIGGQKKLTQVQESTNNPFFNELMVFEFHEPAPVIFDKIIEITALHSKNIISAGTMIGSFKIDVGTVYHAPDHSFNRKWAILIDPNDINGGPKGYLKLDIAVIGRGDALKQAKASNEDEDDVESNLLLPENTPSIRPRANFSVRVYKAEGLPIMNAGLVSGVKKIFTGDVKDLVDPYVQVWFAGQTGRTSVKKNRYDPSWNEQVVFSEMFPPLCRRIKLQLRDKDSVVGGAIGTSYIDLTQISNDGNEGFEPTFGPSWINLYGSTRQYNTMDPDRKLNEGFGEGCMYRGRVLVAFKTDIQDSSLESGGVSVTTESCLPISETAAGAKDEFFLLGTIFSASMIDVALGQKPVSFEFSIGNYGNKIDGKNIHVGRGGGGDDGESDDEEAALLPNEQTPDQPEVSVSTTPPMKPAMTEDDNYMYLPIENEKPIVYIKFTAEEHRRRLYNINILKRMARNLEEGISNVSERLSKDKPNTEKLMRDLNQDFIYSCQNYSKLTKGTGGGSSTGKTKLDKERQKWIKKELEDLVKQAKEQNKGKKWTNKMIKEKLKAAKGYLSRIKFLATEPQDSLPDVFIWLLSAGKRIACARIPAEELIYSVVDEEIGKNCGKMQTVFLMFPGRKIESAEGWVIQAKLELCLWLGLNKHRKDMLKGLPRGYDNPPPLKNCLNPSYMPPASITYNVTNTFQLRCHFYQARSLVGSDESGLSDPFARVVVIDQSKQTEVIEETLSPTWDEMLVLNDVAVHGEREDLKENPPLIAVEIFDVDIGDDCEFIGRALLRPIIKLSSEPYEAPYFPPLLQWHHVYRGTAEAGELLAAIEMIQLNNGELPEDVPPIEVPEQDEEVTRKKNEPPPPLPIPDTIKPKMSRYRIEILFWGMRELKRLQLMTVDKPRVDVECGGVTITSSIVLNATKNPNFPDNVRVMDVDLPENEFYSPPLTFRVVDCRQFGRFTLVGTHVVNSLSQFKMEPKEEPEPIEPPKKSRSRNASAEKQFQAGVPAIEGSNGNMPTPDTVIQVEPASPPPQGDVAITIPPPNGEIPTDANGAVLSDGEPPTDGEDSGEPEEGEEEGEEGGGDAEKGEAGDKAGAKKGDGKDQKKPEEEEVTLDWWTRYYATLAVMKREAAENPPPETNSDDEDGQMETVEVKITPPPETGKAKKKKKKQKKSSENDDINMDMFEGKGRKDDYADITKLQIYPCELEAVADFHGFKEFLHTFDILRGKNTGEDDDGSRTVGKLKGMLKLYNWPLPKSWDARKMFGGDPRLGFFQQLPSSEPVAVIVRVYIVKANDLNPTDAGGKSDPYVCVILGKQKRSDKENYITKNLNPVFGKCFEFEATFPMESKLVVQVFDWDLIGSDDMIGETIIDLENRFYSKHRGVCGICSQYSTFGYNNWRDPQKPTHILKQLCQQNKMYPPAYAPGQVMVNGNLYEADEFLVDEGGTRRPTDENAALQALRHWQEIPGSGGRKLVPEHVETRALYNPEKPGLEQGRIEMWVDMFPQDSILPGAPVDITPRKPKKYELRVVIWNTEDVVLCDESLIGDEKMSDIFVKGWLNGPNEDMQQTDVHYRSLTGEGNFNWRFVFKMDYMEAEELMVVTKKDSAFSDESESKIPPRLSLQVWDADLFSADDFLGSCVLDLNKFPRGAKTSKKCNLEQMKTDGSTPLMNLFKLKRHKGWWPFVATDENDEEELTGKVEAEFDLLTEEEAEKAPAGLARDEPQPLAKPNRPDTSFIWFLSPWKSFQYLICVRLKWLLIKILIVVVIIAFFALFLYNAPGAAVQKVFNSIG